MLVGQRIRVQLPALAIFHIMDDGALAFFPILIIPVVTDGHVMYQK